MLNSTLLDANLINESMAEFGMSIRWYPARRCDCWGKIGGTQEASGGPDPEHAYCGGSGRIYPSYQEVNGVVLAGMENIANWMDDSGVNYTGAIRMHVPYQVNGQPVDLYTQGTLGDLIWAEDIVLTTRTAVQRGVDKLREGLVDVLSLTYGPTTYNVGEDFRVNGRSIEWISAGPPTGDVYECAYTFHPWFSIVQGMAIARNFAHLNLPRQFTLQLTPDLGEVFPGAN